MRFTRARLTPLLLAAPPVVLALALSGYDADARQLWSDELATWHASATLDTAGLSRLLGHMDLAVAPYYLLMRGWVIIAGDTEMALRIPSIVAIALTAGLVTLLGRRLVNKGAGIVAGILFALLPSVSRYAQEARPYAFTMMLAALATLLLLRAIERPTWPRWSLYGLSLILLGLAHVVALSLLAAHFIALRHMARELDSVRLWRWLGPVVPTVTVIGPFALYAARGSQAIAWIKADKAAVRTLPEHLFGSDAVALVVCALAALGIYMLLDSSGPSIPLLSWWTLFPPIFTLVSFPLLHLFLYRYLLFTLPAWVLLAAAGVTLGAERLLGAARRVGPALLIGVVVVPAVALVALPAQAVVRHDPSPGSPDYRRVADVISADLRPGDAIAYGGLQHRARIGMAYVMRDRLKPRDIFLYEPAAATGWYSARECPVPITCLGQTLRVWLVNTSGRSDDPFAEMPPLNAELLRDRFLVADQWEFDHVRVVLLEISADQA